MKCKPICFTAIVERIAPGGPRFTVYSGKAWDETGTFLVDVSLNGVPIGFRNLIPWRERGWHFGLSELVCRKVGIETGDGVRVELHRVGPALPQELEEILKSNPDARRAWNALPSGERRELILSSPTRRSLQRECVIKMNFLGFSRAGSCHTQRQRTWPTSGMSVQPGVTLRQHTEI